VPNDSFFSFFSPPAEEIIEDLGEEETDILNADFEAGQTLRDTIIDSAILYYTGEAVPEEDYDFGGDEDDSDSSEGDEEENEE